MSTVADLRERFRIDYADDNEGVDGDDYLWSDNFFLRQLNRAETEAARRADLLYDTTSYSITLAEDDRDYALDAKIIRVDLVIYDGRALEKTTERDLYEDSPSWTDNDGEPTKWFVKNRTLYFDNAPSSNEDGDTVTLKVYRLPLSTMSDDGDSPEIDDAYHEELLHWVCWRAFSRTDSDTYDKDMADYHFAEFERVFGPPLAADVWRHQLENPEVATIRQKANYYN